MADKQWVTIRPSLDPILAPINTVIQTIDSVLSFLITLLNIAQTILNVVKTFLVGLLDPIRALVEIIIQEVRDIIADLRQLGVYIADDADLLEVSPVNRTRELRGGYDAYERRMLNRLLNRQDPTRPDFTSATAVVALFAYVSTGDVFALIELIKRIKAFFGSPKAPWASAPLMAPTPPSARLGRYGVNVAAYKKVGSLDTAPDAVALEWAMPSTGEVFSAPPKGFLIHVSTVPDGFGLQLVSPKAGTSDEIVELPVTTSVGIDPATGGELRLYGGICDLSADSGADDSGADDDSGANKSGADDPLVSEDTTDPHADRLLLTLDQNTPLIAPGLLDQSGDTPPGGATYYISVPALSRITPGQTYRATLKYEDLPQPLALDFDINPSGRPTTVTGLLAETFYIRVRATTKEFETRTGLSGRPNEPTLVPPFGLTEALYVYSSEDIAKSKKSLTLLPNDAFSSYYLAGPVSQATVVSFPPQETVDLAEATNIALALLILVRADLAEEISDEDGAKPARGTYIKGAGTGLEGFRDLLAAAGIDDRFYDEDNPVAFARRVRQKVLELSDTLFQEQPPASLASALSSASARLRRFKWSMIDPSWPDLTVWESLEQTGGFAGIAGHPTGYAEEGKTRLRKGSFLAGPGLWISRDGVFRSLGGAPVAVGDRFFEGFGYSDTCPVLYRTPNGRDSGVYVLYIQFIRKLLLDYDDGAILRAAASVLQVVSAPRSLSPSAGEWTSIRPLYESLAPLDALLTELDQYMGAILDGLQGSVDKIVSYIDAIQARIYQIQALLDAIRSLLRSLTSFDLPSFSGLVLVENGTDGIAAGLVTSDNKPTDGPLAYGGGAVILAGGLPTILLELLALIFAGGSTAGPNEGGGQTTGGLVP